ncbi:hypothetical protein FALBO_4154 [Fusarium albosuccineum]|uniref:Uncharacterized protein n=1 Tax=Fusarium albosuccineum TaxID=1237068 RepID=A0A8H4LGE2_9HYPO|nr:hypothetical protein FALBO_4154 [Fusarium albosuccineum]
MDETLQPTLDAIAGWTTSPSQLAFDVRFGHIRGPAATAKGIRIPLRISLQMPNVAVIHVVPNFKKAPVIQGRERDPILRGQDSPVHTHTYVEMITLLQSARHATIIIIDADPDFSADFSLALAATTTFAISAASDAGAKMRVLTLSWEKLHPVTKKLFGRGGVPEEFLVPDPGHTKPKRFEHKDVLMVLDRAADHFDPEGKHQALCFQNFGNAAWPSDVLSMHGFDTVQEHPGDPKRCLLYIGNGVRIPGIFEGADFVHVVTSDTARKKIFDLQTRQVLAVTVKLSTSERKQQETWAQRTNCSNRHVYVSATFLSGDNLRRPRRLDILNAQVDGFIVGMAAFAHWPSSFTALANYLHSIDPGDVLLEIQQRLLRRRLIKPDAGNMLGYSLALPQHMHQTFHEFLPLVEYDSCIAQFLCLESSTRLANTAKIQIAMALMASVRDMFKLAVHLMGREEGKELREDARRGLLRDLSPCGTTFTMLGLMKSHKAIADSDLVAEKDREVRGQWLLMNVPVVKRALEMYSDFLVTWQICGNAVTQFSTGQFGDEGRYLSAAEADEVYLHLAQAFTYQMVTVTFRPNMRPKMVDATSGRAVSCSPFVACAVSWKAIQDIDGDSCVGFYTAGRRDGELIEILDWNWIPSRVWNKWLEQPGAGGSIGHLGFKTRHPPHPNEDEATCRGHGAQARSPSSRNRGRRGRGSTAAQSVFSAVGKVPIFTDPDATKNQFEATIDFLKSCSFNVNAAMTTVAARTLVNLGEGWIPATPVPRRLTYHGTDWTTPYVTEGIAYPRMSCPATTAEALDVLKVDKGGGISAY